MPRLATRSFRLVVPHFTLATIFYAAMVFLSGENFATAQITPLTRLQTQLLSPALSKVSFTIQANTLTLSGRLQSFSGKLLLDPSDFERSKLFLEASSSGAKIDQTETAPEITNVLLSLLPKRAAFVSDAIVALGGGRYKVEGHVKSDRGNHRVAFPILLRTISKTLSQIEIEARGSLEREVGDDPIQLLLGESEGRVNCKLSFSRAEN